jgi:hypothetical protein
LTLIRVIVKARPGRGGLQKKWARPDLWDLEELQI